MAFDPNKLGNKGNRPNSIKQLYLNQLIKQKGTSQMILQNNGLSRR